VNFKTPVKLSSDNWQIQTLYMKRPI